MRMFSWTEVTPRNHFEEKLNENAIVFDERVLLLMLLLLTEIKIYENLSSAVGNRQTYCIVR